MVIGMACMYWLLAIGYWLLAIGYWLLAIGYWLLAIGYWLLAIRSGMLIIFHPWPVLPFCPLPGQKAVESNRRPSRCRVRRRPQPARQVLDA